MAELVEQPDTGLASGTGSDKQHPDRFHVAVGGLGHPLGPAAQRRPGRLDGVDGVGLAVAAAGLPVGAINLDHRHPSAAQEAGQPSPVGARALDTDPDHRAEAAQPGVQLGEPGGGRRERFDTQHAAVAVDGGGDMNVEVSVHPTSDRARLYDGHRHPFSLQVVKGWHARPGKETVTIGCANRPIDHPPERGVPMSASTTRSTGISTTLDAPTSQTRAAGADDRSHPPQPVVDHALRPPPSSLALLRAR